MRNSCLRVAICFSLQKLLCLLAGTWFLTEALITSVCDLVLLSECNTFCGYETIFRQCHAFIVGLFFVAGFGEGV